MMKPLIKALFVMLTSATLSLRVAAGDFAIEPGDIYTGDHSTNTIIQVKPDGAEVATLALVGYSLGTKGIAFGPDLSMYVVAVTSTGFDVVRVTPGESHVVVCSGTTYVRGNLSYGLLAISHDLRFYVAGQDDLVMCSPGDATADVIFSANQVFDVDVLPTGNLIVITAYTIVELTRDGVFVREVNTNGYVGEGRGIEYIRDTHTIIATMLGYTDHLFEVMRFDATTGALLGATNFVYGIDIALAEDRTMVIGSRTRAVRRFAEDLTDLGELNSRQRMFVAVAAFDDWVFASSFE